MLLIRSIWPSRPDLIQRLLLLLLSGIYCGLSWWFQQGWVELSCVVKGGLVVTWPRYLEGKEILKWWLAGLDDSSLCLCSPFFFPHFNYNPFTRGWAKEKFRAGLPTFHRQNKHQRKSRYSELRAGSCEVWVEGRAGEKVSSLPLEPEFIISRASKAAQKL